MHRTVKRVLMFALLAYVADVKAGHAVVDYQIGFVGLGGYCGITQVDLTDQYDDGKRHWQTEFTLGSVGVRVPIRGSRLLTMVLVSLVTLTCLSVARA